MTLAMRPLDWPLTKKIKHCLGGGDSFGMCSMHSQTHGEPHVLLTAQDATVLHLSVPW